MVDPKQQKGYAEPDQNNQWQRTSNSNEDTLNRTPVEETDTSGDSSEIEDVQEDGTVAVGSGLGIDE